MKKSHLIRQILLSNLSISLPSSYAWNHPIYVFLEVTNRCNLACTMCGRTHDPRYGQPGHSGDLSLEMVKKLNKIFPFAEYVIPTGVGEPFMNRDLVSMIRYLKERGSQVSITSNGTLLSPAHAEGIVDAGLDKIVFSVDAATRETYEKFRRNARFENVVRNIRRLSECRAARKSSVPVIELELVAMRDNFSELPQWAEMAAELQCQGLIVQKMLGHTGSPQETIFNEQNLNQIPYSRGQATWDSFLAVAQKHNLYLASPFAALDLRAEFGPDPVPADPSRQAESCDADPPQGVPVPSGPVEADVPAALPDRPAEPILPETAARRLYCTQPWSVIYVTWKGEVRTCCFNEYCLGNLEQARFAEIWNGRRYREMRRAVRKGQVLDICRDCLKSNLNYSVIKNWKRSVKEILFRKPGGK